MSWPILRMLPPDNGESISGLFIEPLALPLHDHPGIAVDRPKRGLQVMRYRITERFQFLVGCFQLRGAFDNPLLQLFFELPQLLFRLFAFGHVQYRRPAFPAILGGGCLDLDVEALPLPSAQPNGAALLLSALEDLLQKGFAGRDVGLGNEMTEPAVQKRGALEAEKARPGEVHLADGAVGTQGEVAHGGEVVEVQVALPLRLGLIPRLFQLFVLHLQFDLVDLQFLDEPLLHGSRHPVSGCLTLAFPLRDQPGLRAATQSVAILLLIPLLFHDAVSVVSEVDSIGRSSPFGCAGRFPPEGLFGPCPVSLSCR